LCAAGHDDSAPRRMESPFTAQIAELVKNGKKPAGVAGWC
jgi:hypothetical protein